MADANTTLICWQCTQCGRRYVDPSPTSLFIVPPPTTPCMRTERDETRTQAHGDFVDLSSATCDYMRMQQNARKIKVCEQNTGPKDGTSAMDLPMASKFLAQRCDSAFMKAVGEHGRVSRHSEDFDVICNEDDAEDCVFWRTDCKDVDCIYKGEHCRYQCATAELDEEPNLVAPAPRRGLRFRWSAR